MDPTTRKNLIMDAALIEFLKHGYERTPIKAIVQQAKVSKGLFYHYFISKEDILSQILQRHINHYLTKIEQKLVSIPKQPIKQLESIFIITSHEDSEDLVIKFLNIEQSPIVLNMITEKVMNNLHSIVLRILQEGNQMKVFDIEYLEEIVDILMYLYQKVVESKHKLSSSEFMTKLKGFEFAINRILGVSEKIIKFPYEN